MSHPRCKVLDSRITSRPDPASFRPPAGIKLSRPAPLPGPAERVSTNGTVAVGVGPEREENLRGFRGLAMVFAEFGRSGGAGP